MKTYKYDGLYRIAICVMAALCTMPAIADETNDQTFIDAKDMKWGDAPPVLPKGAKITLLHGDPNKEGPYVIRMMAPAGYKIPPHWHSQNENLTVLSGTLYLGMGDKMEPSQAHPLKANGFHYLPAKTHHYAFAKNQTVIQIHGQGPFDIVYVNPEDDPQKAAAKK
jgi:hypothetical protein